MRRSRGRPSLDAARRSPLLAALPLVLAAAAATACSNATPEAFDGRMATYVGRPEADVVTGLGVPSRTYEGDGRRLLQYEFARPSSSPVLFPSIGLGFGTGGWRGGGFGVGTGLGVGLGGYGAPAGCVLVFESREGRITGFTRNGPGCVASAA